MGIRVEFGKYELVERLASGGMGETWLADLHAMEGVRKQVVIKKLLPDLAERPEVVRAFIDEARLSATLSHGNIAQVFDFGQVDGEYFLALEFVHGQSLERVLARAKKLGQPRLPFALSVYVVTELLKALHYAHTRVDQNGKPLEIVHRDVTPDNVLISYDGEVKLVDFGVAKTSELGRSKTTPGMVKGKYRYHSPEQALAYPLDRRSDVFGAGIVLFEMLCGGPMFTAVGHVAMQQVANGEIPQLRVRAPDVPEALAEIAMHALKREQADRFSTALQMQEQLTRWLFASTPEFSAELLRELMTALFERELVDEGRLPARNKRRTEELDALMKPTATPVVAAPAAHGTTAPVVARVKRRRLVLAAIGAALALGGVLALSFDPSAPSAAPCERQGDAALASGNEAAARFAIQSCLGARAPTAAESEALARVEQALATRAALTAAPRDEALPAVPVAPGPQLVDEVETEPELPDLPPAPKVNSAALEAQARADLHAENFVAAKRAAQQCVKVDPKNAECFKLLGGAAGRLGEGKAGAAAFRKFLELAPNHPQARQVRALLESARKGE